MVGGGFLFSCDRKEAVMNKKNRNKSSENQIYISHLLYIFINEMNKLILIPRSNLFTFIYRLICVGEGGGGAAGLVKAYDDVKLKKIDFTL